MRYSSVAFTLISFFYVFLIFSRDSDGLRVSARSLAESLENIELSFVSLVRVSSDVPVEQKWNSAQTELPFVVALLRNLSVNTELLSKAESVKFKFLQNQIIGLQGVLASQEERLFIPELGE